jgi:hypothetical protein
MRLSAQGRVVPQIEILTYSVYAPFPIRGTPFPEPLPTFLRWVLVLLSYSLQ